MNALDELKIEKPGKEQRSLFHLNDPDLLRGMIKEAGFSKAIWYNFIMPMSEINVDNLLREFLIYPPVEKLLKYYDE